MVFLHDTTPKPFSFSRFQLLRVCRQVSTLLNFPSADFTTLRFHRPFHRGTEANPLLAGVQFSENVFLIAFLEYTCSQFGVGANFDIDLT